MRVQEASKKVSQTFHLTIFYVVDVTEMDYHEISMYNFISVFFSSVVKWT